MAGVNKGYYGVDYSNEQFFADMGIAALSFATSFIPGGAEVAK